MKTPTQTHAIDFDSAKLQRLGFGHPTALPRRPATIVQLRQQLVQQLQTSLEVERVLGAFFREVQRLVPLDALHYRHEASDLRLEFGHRGHHSVSYGLSHEGEHLGELVFRRNQRLTEEELGQLESLLSTLLYPMRNALLYRAATRSALRDPLTETGNRIAMDQTLQREIDMARRHLSPLSVLMLDIDHFKTINDTHGHAVRRQRLAHYRGGDQEPVAQRRHGVPVWRGRVSDPAVQHRAGCGQDGWRTSAPGGTGPGLLGGRCAD